MAGNAHRNRAKKRSVPCLSTCPFCQYRPSEARRLGFPWENKKTTDRRNYWAKKRGRKNRNR